MKENKNLIGIVLPVVLILSLIIIGSIFKIGYRNFNEGTVYSKVRNSGFNKVTSTNDYTDVFTSDSIDILYKKKVSDKNARKIFNNLKEVSENVYYDSLEYIETRDESLLNLRQEDVLLIKENEKLLKNVNGNFESLERLNKQYLEVQNDVSFSKYFNHFITPTNKVFVIIVVPILLFILALMFIDIGVDIVNKNGNFVSIIYYLLGFFVFISLTVIATNNVSLYNDPYHLINENSNNVKKHNIALSENLYAKDEEFIDLFIELENNTNTIVGKFDSFNLVDRGLYKSRKEVLSNEDLNILRKNILKAEALKQNIRKTKENKVLLDNLNNIIKTNNYLMNVKPIEFSPILYIISMPFFILLSFIFKPVLLGIERRLIKNKSI